MLSDNVYYLFVKTQIKNGVHHTGHGSARARTNGNQQRFPMAKKYCYLFSEGNANMRELLGGKGANLAEMTNIGMPVPQGFTITTEACTQYYEDGRQINAFWGLCKSRCFRAQKNPRGCADRRESAARKKEGKRAARGKDRR